MRVFLAVCRDCAVQIRGFYGIRDAVFALESEATGRGFRGVRDANAFIKGYGRRGVRGFRGVRGAVFALESVATGRGFRGVRVVR